MRISRITLLLGLFIIFSASFTQQILFYCFEKFGRLQTENCLGLFFALLLATSVIFIFKKPFAVYRKLIFFLLFAFGLILSWRLPLVAERIHILEYGLLGWLALRDNGQRTVNFSTIAKALLIILLFGLLDEGFQFFLPWRVCDWRDAALNLAGGSWGIGLFLSNKQLKDSLDIAR